MSKLVSNIQANTNTALNNNAANTERKVAKVWLNIGFINPDYQDKNGNPIRVTLPLGLPLDVIKDGTVNSNAPDSIKAAILGGNMLKKELLEIAENMEAGECKNLEGCGLTLFLQKIGEKAEEAAATKEDIEKKSEDRLKAMFKKID